MAIAGYDFFVSYAHEDLERVRRLDRALRELLRRPFRRAGFQVFRDERRLAAGSDLTGRLHGPMRESRALVVVLSPSSAVSPWVDKEIEFWCEELGRAENLILVRADPAIDLEWDDAAGTFRHPDKLPPALVRATNALPFYVELGDTTAADHEAAVRIAASLLGRAPEEIAGEDYRLQKRRRRLAVSAVSGLAVLTVVAVIAGVLAVRASNTAKDNEQRAVADLLANRGIVEQDDRPDKALALAVAARRQDDRSEGRNVLLRLLRGLDSRDHFYRLEAEPTAIAVSPAGDMLAIGDEGGGVRIAKLPADRLPDAPQADLGSRVIGIDFADDNRLVAGIEGNRVVELSVPDLEKTAEIETAYFDAWAFNRRTGLIAAGGQEPLGEDRFEPRLTLLRSTPGALDTVTGGHDYGESDLLPYMDALAFDPAGSQLAVNAFVGAILLDVPSLEPVPGDDGLRAFGEARALAFTKHGALALGGDPQESNAFRGLLNVRATSAARLYGTAEFEQSVRVLTPCRGTLAFGTDAGEYGLVTDPLGETRPTAGSRPFADVSGGVRDIACEKAGPLAVAAGGGLVHLRDYGRTIEQFDSSAHSALLLFVTASEVVPDEIDLRGMALSSDGSEVLLRSGKRFQVSGPDRGRIGTVAAGAPTGTANCLSVDHDTLQRTGKDPSDEPLSVGRCGDLQFRITGPKGTALEIRRGDETVATIPAGRRGGTFAVAVSDDARELFVGGYFESTLYDISDPAEPQPIVQLPSEAFIGNASFAAGGDVLITAEYFPPSYAYVVHVTAIDGAPLERLACSVGAGALQGTLATRVLSDDRLDPCG